MKMARFTLAVSVLCIIVVLQRVQQTEACGKPNIVFILADDLGVGDTSIPGYAVASGDVQIQTPNLERMARNGAIFTRAYTPAPVCGPSRYSLMSGRHTGHMQIRGNTGVGDDYSIPCGSSQEDILSHALKANGYHTAIIGKWGFQNHPFDCGFDRFYGQRTHLDSHSFFPTKMHDNYIENPSVRNENLQLPKNRFATEAHCTENIENCDFVHDLFTQASVRYVREQVSKNNPFFLFLSYSTPHVGAWRPLEDITRPRFKLHKVAPDYECPEEFAVPSNVLKVEECRHRAAVENYLDRDVGVMLNLFENLGIAQNTLVAFAADNGPDFDVLLGGKTVHSRVFNSAGNRIGGKRNLFEGGILTPFVLQWPGKIKANVYHNSLTSLTDLFSTFIAVSKSEEYLRHPEVVDGLSLLPIMTGKDSCGLLDCCNYVEGKVEHEYLYWEYCDQQVANWKDIRVEPEKFCSRAIHSKDGWKLMYEHNERRNYLFDMSGARDGKDFSQLEREVVSNPQKRLELAQKINENRFSLEAAGYTGTNVITEHIYTPFPTTRAPTKEPTKRPTTLNPTLAPTSLSPTGSPTTLAPTGKPTTGDPTLNPSTSPTLNPTTSNPTLSPVTDPTPEPVPEPSRSPTSNPTTAAPTNLPSSTPTAPPTKVDMSSARCEASGEISASTGVQDAEECLDRCFDEVECTHYSYSAKCKCCALYRSCNRPVSVVGQFFDDWSTISIVVTEPPTPEPTLAPAGDQTPLGRTIADSGILGIATAVTTLVIMGLVVICTITKFTTSVDKSRAGRRADSLDSFGSSSDEASYATA